MVKDSVEKEPSHQKPGETSDKKYKGVRKRKWGKWVSEIRLPNSRERIWLGSYDSAEKAARAFDAALFCLRGRTAKFNFPDNPPNISNGRSLTPSEIQAAAHQFANSGSDPPPSSSDNSMYELQTESQSPSLSPSPSVVSDGGGAILENELNAGGPYMDLLTSNMGSGNYASDYGIFPGFDDLSNDYYVPNIPSVDYGEENYDASFNQGSFLWNF